MQDLSLQIWHLYDLDEICSDLYELVILVAEAMNRHKLFSVDIGRNRLQNSNGNFHRLHFVQVWKITSGVNFDGLDIRTALRTIFWDKTSLPGLIHFAQDKSRLHCQISAYGVYLNVSSTAL